MPERKHAGAGEPGTVPERKHAGAGEPGTVPERKHAEAESAQKREYGSGIIKVNRGTGIGELYVSEKFNYQSGLYLHQDRRV